MPRARNIKPGFFTNDELAEIAPLGRLLFIALWTMADRAGRLEDRPKRIKAEALPYDDCDADALLDDLAARGFLRRYRRGGLRIIQVVNFSKHQNPHIREPESALPEHPEASLDRPEPGGNVAQSIDENPEPDEHSTSTVQEPERHEPSRADSGFLIPDSGFLIPDSGFLIPDTRERKAGGGSLPRACACEGGGADPLKKPLSLPDDCPTEFDLEWARRERQDVNVEAVRDKFRDHFRARHGPDSLRADWSAEWRNWVRREWGSSRGGAPPGGRTAAQERQRETIDGLTGRRRQSRKNSEVVVDVVAVERTTRRLG